MGRKPKPSKIKELLGNPGKKKSKKPEPEPIPSIPRQPNYLCKEAGEEWRRIIPELESLGLMSQIDLIALALYCQTVGRWIKAERMILKHGATITTPNGMLQTSPYVTQANQAALMAEKFLSNFGLSPSSRTKVSASAPKEEDPLAKYGAKKTPPDPGSDN